MKESELKLLQNNGLFILKTLDRICKKYNIQYFALYGTALGAVRHGGFIPWDDDVDVGMLRSEYNKLLLVPKEEWGKCYLTDPSYDDPAHDKLFPRIYLSGTTLVTKEWFERAGRCKTTEKNYLPIWLDIFIFDEVHSQKEFYRLFNLSSKYKRRYYYTKFPVRFGASKSIRHKLLFAYSCFFRLFYSPKRIYLKLMKKLTISSGEYICSFSPWELFDAESTLWLKEEFFPLVEVPFEDILINLPNNYRRVLEKAYGDYMQLPPPEKRQHHDIFLLKCEEV